MLYTNYTVVHGQTSLKLAWPCCLIHKWSKYVHLCVRMCAPEALTTLSIQNIAFYDGIQYGW